MGERRDTHGETAPTDGHSRARSPGCTGRAEERRDWNCGLIGATEEVGPQGPADTCERQTGLRENRQEGGAAGGRAETKSKSRPGLSVILSACPAATRPPAPPGAGRHGQVEPPDRLNHHIYSNCSVIVPKEPGSNELDIIKILMPSFHS